MRLHGRQRTVTPNQLWVADATYIPTAAGFYYLAVVLDVSSRRIVGWAMGSHLRTALMLQALDMALAQRHPSAVIHHSDQGCPIHVSGLWPTLSGCGRAPLHGLSGRRLRQRHV